MTPEWLIQLLWFIASSIAVGAFFYYLAIKNKRKAFYWLLLSLTIAAFNVVVMVRNDIIKNGMTAQVNYIQARYNTSLILKYPGPIIYVYNSKLGDLIAPIGYALNVEVINNRPSSTKISSYFLDIGVGGQWVRLPNLSILNPMDVFWVNNSDLRNCTRLDFRANGFDQLARYKSISTGESIKGWMFFEWPAELRGHIPVFNKIRLYIENIQGDKEYFVLDTSNIQDAGISSLGGGEIVVRPKSENVDMSGLKIMPHIDLLNGFKDGSIK